MTTQQITDIKGWKQASPVKSGVPLEFPSGKVARVRLPGIEVFFRLNVIPNSLMPLIQKSMSAAAGEGDGGPKGKSKNPFEEQNLGKLLEQKPELLSEMMETIDAITVYCFQEPAVYKLPEEGQERDDNKLYVDEIDLDDKMFLFNAAVGGTKDLEQFRKRSGRSVGSVPARKSAVKPTKRTGGTARKKS